MELSKAKIVASTVARLVEPHCSKFVIAGSVRRERPEVKDIELVLRPNIIISGGADLFGDAPQVEELDPKFVSAIKGLGTITAGKLNPKVGYLQITHESFYGNINLDIFVPRQDDFFRQLAIRTGSADWVFKNIAARWVRNGWVAVDKKGLRRREDCVNVNEGKQDKAGVRLKPKWELRNEDAEKPPVWISEENFFNWLGLQWVHPKNREV